MNLRPVCTNHPEFTLECPRWKRGAQLLFADDSDMLVSAVRIAIEETECRPRKGHLGSVISTYKLLVDAGEDLKNTLCRDLLDERQLFVALYQALKPMVNVLHDAPLTPHHQVREYMLNKDWDAVVAALKALEPPRQ